ncbi:MAG: LUD domain-containing protein [Bacteroidota bacterium]
MKLFERLFGKSNKKSRKKSRKDPDESKFMPEPKLPVDEEFMNNFKGNGGKFLYCENEDELQNTFQSIIAENNWYEDKVYCTSDSLCSRFDIDKSKLDKSKNATYFVSVCEYLIANTGALLVTSDQIGEKKLAELPDNFIILAKTSQLLETIGEGLQLIKQKHKDRIPSNITTMKTFEGKQNNDFLSYGSPSKNLYLLLLEDL